MKPVRNLRFTGKKENFAVVAYRYGSPKILAYNQYKDPESVTDFVYRMLGQGGELPNKADVISIRRIYLDDDSETETQDEQTKMNEGGPT